MERRKFPRVCEAIPFEIRGGAANVATTTRNLSCAGALCALSEAIPLMTKLDVALILPPIEAEASPLRIHCVGVVVRVGRGDDSQGSHSFLTAIYFSEIAPEDRRRIAEFVLNSMLSHDRRRS